MLENNMENAETPERLVIYGGIGKCARNWESYHAIVKSLKELENDETLVVQSGMPVAPLNLNQIGGSIGGPGGARKFVLLLPKSATNGTALVSGIITG